MTCDAGDDRAAIGDPTALVAETPLRVTPPGTDAVAEPATADADTPLSETDASTNVEPAELAAVTADIGGNDDATSDPIAIVANTLDIARAIAAVADPALIDDELDLRPSDGVLAENFVELWRAYRERPRPGCDCVLFTPSMLATVYVNVICPAAPARLDASMLPTAPVEPPPGALPARARPEAK